MDGRNQCSEETLPDSEALMAQLNSARKKIAAGEASEKLVSLFLFFHIDSLFAV